ncbi:MAG: hypothetical protein ABI641_05225 [Caldimonas sp.]
MSNGYCPQCRSVTFGDSVCASCGAAKGGVGIGVLPLIGWLAIPFLIPIYPLMGGLSTLAMVAAGLLAGALGAGDGVRLLAIAVTGYLAIVFTLRFERAASRLAAYRALRTGLRVLICVAIAGSALFGSDKDLSSGAAFLIAFVAVPLVFWLARRFDRMLGLRAPEHQAEGA